MTLNDWVTIEEKAVYTAQGDGTVCSTEARVTAGPRTPWFLRTPLERFCLHRFTKNAENAKVRLFRALAQPPAAHPPPPAAGIGAVCD